MAPRTRYNKVPWQLALLPAISPLRHSRDKISRAGRAIQWAYGFQSHTLELLAGECSAFLASGSDPN